jgi:hypothetical protein
LILTFAKAAASRRDTNVGIGRRGRNSLLIRIDASSADRHDFGGGLGGGTSPSFDMQSLK